MGHEHNHSEGIQNKKVLLISFIIIFTFMIVEVVGGFLTNSLALLSDAGHMLSDAISLGIALVAFIVAEKVSNSNRTYGFKRIEILAACINGLTLIGIAIFIVIEAIQRFQEPVEVASIGMLIISTIGLIVNIIVAWIMMRGADTEHNLNMRGAFLHVLSDMLGSVAAIIAALLIMWFDFTWADPLVSLIVALLVLRGGISVTKNALHILMESSPQNVEVEKIMTILQNPAQVIAIHDFHVWTVTSGYNVLTCHLVVAKSLTIQDSTLLAQKLEHDLYHENIHHVTLQFESDEHLHENEVYCNQKAQKGGHHHHH